MKNYLKEIINNRKIVERKEKNMMGIPVNMESLQAGSPLNNLFNHFFLLNKTVLSIPVSERDGLFAEYAYQQAILFYRDCYTEYAKELATVFKDFVKKYPSAQMSFEKETIEFCFFERFWLLHQKFVNGDRDHFRNDEYWEMVCRETSAIHEQYKQFLGKEYTAGILSAFLNELARKEKDEKKYFERRAYNVG